MAKASLGSPLSGFQAWNGKQDSNATGFLGPIHTCVFPPLPYYITFPIAPLIPGGCIPALMGVLSGSSTSGICLLTDLMLVLLIRRVPQYVLRHICDTLGCHTGHCAYQHKVRLGLRHKKYTVHYSFLVLLTVYYEACDFQEIYHCCGYPGLTYVIIPVYFFYFIVWLCVRIIFLCSCSFQIGDWEERRKWV